MQHRVLQPPVLPSADLEVPTPSEIAAEPTFRRASASFVAVHGGELAQAFLKALDSMGMVNDSTRFMCQRSPLVQGAFPSPPNWHVDYMPGTPNRFQLHVSQPTSGAIACVCSLDRISTTLFLDESVITLEEPAGDPRVATGNEYLEASGAPLNWCTPQVDALIADGLAQAKSITPNRIFQYDSRNLHRAPQFELTGGHRIVLRANTPPASFPYEIPVQDQLLRHRDFFFLLEGDTWQKYEL